jgi:hypothetical protein
VSGSSRIGEAHGRVDRDAFLALAHLVAGLEPAAIAEDVGRGGALSEDQQLVRERVAREAAHRREQRDQRLTGLGEFGLERAEQVVDRGAGFGVHLREAPCLSRDPTVPSPVVRGTGGGPTREPVPPSTDGARGRVTRQAE